MQQQTYSPPRRSNVPRANKCGACGRTLTPNPMDWTRQLSEMFSPLVENWNRTWGSMVDPWTQAMQKAWGTVMPSPTGTYAESCSCHRCEVEDCHCKCCVTDADLLVYSRLGEQRVVPITIENNMRREREVDLELSSWTTHGGQDGPINARLVAPTKFTLKACEERTVIMVVHVLTPQPGQAVKGADAATTATATAPPTAPATVTATTGTRATQPGADVQSSQPPSTATHDNEPRLADVDDCKVYYSDLRVKGCDIRPVRIAVAVLPRDCGSHRISCRCGCC